MTPDLIEKLSEAQGPSRELDKAIVQTLYPEAIVQPYCSDDDTLTVYHAEPLVRNKRELPFFSESIDAALTLYDKEEMAFAMLEDAMCHLMCREGPITKWRVLKQFLTESLRARSQEGT